MRFFKFLTVFTILASLASQFHAQERFNENIPRLDSTSIYYFFNTIDSADFPLFYPYDSTLSGIEKSNPSWNDAVFADLGNIGQAQKNLLFVHRRFSGFNYKEIPYYSYIKNVASPIYYRSLLPYSEAHYHLGAKKEQVVGADFSGNLYRGLTLGLSFDLTYCPGSYINQKAATNNLHLSLRYFTPNYRYGVIGAFSHYKINVGENGGLVDDKVFEDQLELRPEAIPVHLTQGGTTIRNYGFEVTQYFNITKPAVPRKREETFDYMPVVDSLQIDSLLVQSEILSDSLLVPPPEKVDAFDGPEIRKFNWGRLGWNMKTSDLAWRYDNPSLPSSREGYFPAYYRDSTKTHDSTRFFMFENTFSYSNANLNPRSQSNQFRYYLYLQYQYVNLNIHSRDSSQNIGSYAASFSYNQLIPKAQIAMRVFRTFELRATADYVLSGYNQGDFSLSGSLSNIFGKGTLKTKLQIEAMAALQMPEWFYHFYNGNHYQWDNKLDKVNYYVLGASLSNKWGMLSGNYFLLSNYVYLNNEAVPEVSSNIESVLRLSLDSKIRIGKHWTLDNFLAYQESFGSEAIKLPSFVYNGSFYFGFHLFKKSLYLMPGISIFYNTSYFADAYSPSLNSFYRQNDKETGNYIYADFFVNLHIKRARIFLKYRHFDKALLANTSMGYTYYMIPHYPQIGGGFYAGISWRFIN
ncbi:MAG: putative porin [Bacteroidales bacterium]|jgi:hypothetical protein|nr:putative porin [Bacteroidales bacterium]